MIEFDLPQPYFLEKQVAEIAKRKNIPEEVAMAIHFGRLSAVLDNEGNLVDTRKTYHVDGDSVMRMDMKDDEILTGDAALMKICPEAKPITRIVIPQEVQARATKKEYEDIQFLATSLKGRVDRFNRIQKLNAPKNILIMETMMLDSRIEALEHNKFENIDARVTERSVLGDVRYRRALNDVGYSLTGEWLFTDESVNPADPSDEKEDKSNG